MSGNSVSVEGSTVYKSSIIILFMMLNWQRLTSTHIYDIYNRLLMSSLIYRIAYSVKMLQSIQTIGPNIQHG